MDDERSLQRVTDPGYLADLAQADAPRIREMRDACGAAERRLSFVRRVVQGHLDLALAEVARRGGAQPAPLAERVARALTGPDGGGRSARAVGLYDPDDGDTAGDADTARLPDVDDATLDALVARLQRRERALSDQRAVLLGHLDRLQDALVARYRDDRGAIDDLAGTLGGH